RWRSAPPARARSRAPRRQRGAGPPSRGHSRLAPPAVARDLVEVVMTKRLSLVAALVLACGSLTPAAALTGREGIDTAQKKSGFSTWRDRVLGASMETYTTTLARTREANVSEQTEPRGEHRTVMEF